MGIRRWFATRKRERVADIWPIKPGADRPPEGWSGWPEGKQFGLVLTHDVESQSGVNKCRQLMQLELEYGFRSSFNFTPEGGYSVPGELREELICNGFEVGVHDLYHDGKLFQRRNEFNRNAVRINQYLKEWNAVGFRSAFMLHNLDWLHDLDIQYDASTFDTDPFEPQPQGRHTIFPFWVPRPNDAEPHFTVGHRNGNGNGNGNSPFATRPPSLPEGYVELPYTLPQDFTLFLLFRDRHPDVWFQKLDWVAKRGGMVLIDTHPDYMAMGRDPQSPQEYPINFYERFLEYVRSRHSGAFWHALPREVAQLVRASRSGAHAGASAAPVCTLAEGNHKPKLWIDLDNTPHVPFFEPIIQELQARGFTLLVTARDAFQVYELADKKGLQYIKVGCHHGKNRLRKAAGLAYRALQLAPLVLREWPALAVSHGSRAQLLLCNCVGIPTVLIEDYEYCRFPPMMRPTWVMAPSVIPDATLCRKNGHIRKYFGIKENAYAWKLNPDPGILSVLGIVESQLFVTVRPPATEAHYHDPESERLFEAFMDRACQTPNARVVLLPRNQRQAEIIRHHWPEWFADGKTVVPDSVLDGLNLIWHSDLVVSGGGTMNREAAALGVPVYTIFRGSIGAVDRHLTAEGRLVLIESVGDVASKINLVKRPRKTVAEVTSRRTLQEIVDAIQEIAGQVSG